MTFRAGKIARWWRALTALLLYPQMPVTPPPGDRMPLAFSGTHTRVAYMQTHSSINKNKKSLKKKPRNAICGYRCSSLLEHFANITQSVPSPKAWEVGSGGWNILVLWNIIIFIIFYIVLFKKKSLTSRTSPLRRSNMSVFKTILFFVVCFLLSVMFSLTFSLCGEGLNLKESLERKHLDLKRPACC